MKQCIHQNSGFILLITAVILFCPPYIHADTPTEDDSYERGYELGREFERGYKLGRREREGRNRVIASGHGLSFGSSRYSFRDWDEDWGFSVSLTPWDQTIVGDTDSKKCRIRFDELRFGWFPLSASVQETFTISQIPETISSEIGFSIEGDAYFVETLGGTRYPLTKTISIPFRGGLGLTWFDLQETDNITIDDVDYTQHFNQEVDWMLDLHLLIGTGIEFHSPNPGFAVGAMVGYRLTIWELWNIDTTFTDPHTGRERTIRDRGAEFLDGSAKGMTVDLYCRYLF